MKTLLLVLLLTGLCRGESVEARLVAFPPEVTLWRVADGPGGLVLVGSRFERAWFEDASGRLGSLTLVARAPGYADEKLVVTWESLPAGLHVSLRPLSFWTGVVDQVRVRPYLLLLVLIPVSVAGGLVWLSRDAQRRRALAGQQLSLLEGAKAALRADSSDPYLGKHFGPYVLTRRLGVGGMGFVYRASGPEGEVALKVIRPEFSQEGEFRERFWREIKLAGKLNHRGIVKILACDVQDDLLYYVMELVNGQDLGGRIPESGLPAGEAVQLLLPCFEALEVAHKAGIVHRDLKPSNILVEDSGRVVLMDFGLAKSPDSPPLTATGAALGTPAYMAPEQIMGRLDKRSDQYAMGIILYELLCGRRPFLESDMSVIWKHVSAEVPAPSSFRADLPAAVEQIVLRMLSKDPDQRFEELSDARLALMRALG